MIIKIGFDKYMRVNNTKLTQKKTKLLSGGEKITFSSIKKTFSH